MPFPLCLSLLFEPPPMSTPIIMSSGLRLCTIPVSQGAEQVALMRRELATIEKALSSAPPTELVASLQNALRQAEARCTALEKVDITFRSPLDPPKRISRGVQGAGFGRGFGRLSFSMLHGPLSAQRRDLRQSEKGKAFRVLLILHLASSIPSRLPLRDALWLRPA